MRTSSLQRLGFPHGEDPTCILSVSEVQCTYRTLRNICRSLSIPALLRQGTIAAVPVKVLAVGEMGQAL